MLHSYLFYLLLISLVVFCFERMFAARKQKIFRKYWTRDVFFLLFNGEIFAFSLAWFEIKILHWNGYQNLIYDKPLHLSSYDLWVQIVFFLIFRDFIEYWIHRLLHSNNFLWKFHQVHHSVTNMDFWCNFRFHFAEIIFYKHLGFVIPLLVGVDYTAVFVGACLSTLIGHLNHSNLSWSYGPLKYVFNNPAMHLWHHEIRNQPNLVCNFGVLFSTWDFVFGTAYLNSKTQPQIGLDDNGFTEKYPLGIFSWIIIGLSCLIYFGIH